MAGDRLPFHKQCVKCCKCQKSLSPSSLNNHQNKLYCNNCYDEVFMSQDYSLGSYGGIVTPEDIKRKEDEERRRLEKAERAKAEKRCPTCELKVKITKFLYILLTEDGNKYELPHSRMLSEFPKVASFHDLCKNDDFYHRICRTCIVGKHFVVFSPRKFVSNNQFSISCMM